MYSLHGNPLNILSANVNSLLSKVAVLEETSQNRDIWFLQETKITEVTAQRAQKLLGKVGKILHLGALVPPKLQLNNQYGLVGQSAGVAIAVSKNLP